ncbi:MAG: hypothetical protein P4L42_14080 [Desulfocapsaceae bacterium]|nr:hypothetical protein [Desulfocapsaceae bacterium]
MKDDNLTDPLEIKYALERQLGYGALNKIAIVCGVSPPSVSNTIRKRRSSRKVLACIANIIGQPVHGIAPAVSEPMGKPIGEAPSPIK